MRIVFTTERLTKNMVRFKEEAPAGDEKIGTLYIRKGALAELGDPVKLVITIEAG